jgi:hypothetical protein
LELSPLLLKSPGAVLPDKLATSMVEEINIETYELVYCSKGFVGLRVGMSGTKWPILSNGIDSFLNVGGAPCQFRQIVLPVVGPHGMSP